MRKCPKCLKKQLFEIEFHETLIDKCSSCEGLWFDRNEIDKVSKVIDQKISIPSDLKPVKWLCPHCSKAMFAFNYPQTTVVIDMCNSCHGIWLDKNELQRIHNERASKNGKSQWAEDDNTKDGWLLIGLEIATSIFIL